MPICVLKRGDLCGRGKFFATEKQNGRQPRFVSHAFARAAQRKLPIVDRDYCACDEHS